MEEAVRWFGLKNKHNEWNLTQQEKEDLSLLLMMQ